MFPRFLFLYSLNFLESPVSFLFDFNLLVQVNLLTLWQVLNLTKQYIVLKSKLLES